MNRQRQLTLFTQREREKERAEGRERGREKERQVGGHTDTQRVRGDWVLEFHTSGNITVTSTHERRPNGGIKALLLAPSLFSQTFNVASTGANVTRKTYFSGSNEPPSKVQ